MSGWLQRANRKASRTGPEGESYVAKNRAKTASDYLLVKSSPFGRDAAGMMFGFMDDRTSLPPSGRRERVRKPN